MTRYFQILIAADARTVSTLNATSTQPALTPSAALIDKVCGELVSPIPRAVLLNRLKSAGLAHRVTKLRDKRWHLEVGGPDSGLYFFLGHMNADAVRKLTSRPSAFNSFQDYEAALSNILTDQERAEMRLTRMDLALDYKAPLEQLIHGLDVSHKLVRIAYTDKGSARTGVTIGKGSEKIVVYDKAKESSLPGPRTRIEIQLTGAKLPARRLSDLPTILSNPKKWPCFGNVSLAHVAVGENIVGFTEIQKVRLADLRSILKREGLLSARRTLNAKGNFDRDYGPFLEITPASEQPMQAFQRLIGDFLTEHAASEAQCASKNVTQTL